jgi:hypothetical protein
MKRDIETIGLVAVLAFASSESYLAAAGEFSYDGTTVSLSSRTAEGVRVAFSDQIAPGDLLMLASEDGLRSAILSVNGWVDRSSEDRANFSASMVATNLPFPFVVGDQVTLFLHKRFDPDTIMTDGSGDVMVDSYGNVMISLA